MKNNYRRYVWRDDLARKTLRGTVDYIDDVYHAYFSTFEIVFKSYVSSGNIWYFY